MTTSRWLAHLRESFAAVAAGSRMVPLGDNGEAQRSLALELARIRRASRDGHRRETRSPGHLR